jgi:hypothetical protein
LRVARNRNNTLWRSWLGDGVDGATAECDNGKRVAHLTRFITNRQNII